MLASTACTEARIAGLNLYDLNTFATFRGTIGIYSTCIGETAFGVAGLIEKQQHRKDSRSSLDRLQALTGTLGKSPMLTKKPSN